MKKIEIPKDERVRVLSLGAGVQSSTLAFLYQNGVLKPAPHFAIFAAVSYTHLTLPTILRV